MGLLYKLQLYSAPKLFDSMPKQLNKTLFLCFFHRFSPIYSSASQQSKRYITYFYWTEVLGMYVIFESSYNIACDEYAIFVPFENLGGTEIFGGRKYLLYVYFSGCFGFCTMSCLIWDLYPFVHHPYFFFYKLSLLE